MQARAPSIPEDPAKYMMIFGKQKDQLVKDLNEGYIAWMKREHKKTKMFDKYPGLEGAIKHHEKSKKPKRSRSPRRYSKNSELLPWLTHIRALRM